MRLLQSLSRSHRSRPAVEVLQPLMESLSFYQQGDRPPLRSVLTDAPLAQLDRALDYKLSGQKYGFSWARQRRVCRSSLTHFDPV